MTPTLALALEDFVPVLLTLLALSLLCRITHQMHRSCGYIALLGLLLVVAGGLLKATSKIFWVIAGQPIAWMEASLFLLMAPGFACLVWAIWSGQKSFFGAAQPRFVWQVPLLLLLFTGFGTVYTNGSNQGRTWFLVLLTLVVVMSSLMLILLSRHAWSYQLRGIAFLFLLYLLLTLVLNGLARTPSPTTSMEWVKQLLNTAAAAILAFASWRLWLATRQTPDLGV